MALQVSAIKVGEHFTLTFTRVLDEVTPGADDDGPDPVDSVNRAYWEKTNKAMLEIADEVLGILKSFDASLELSYNKAFIGLTRQGRANNFVVIEPRKNSALVSIKLPQSEEIDKKFEDTELDLLPYSTRYGQYRPRIGKGDVAKYGDLLRTLLELANKNAME